MKYLIVIGWTLRAIAAVGLPLSFVVAGVSVAANNMEGLRTGIGMAACSVALFMLGMMLSHLDEL